MTHFQTEEGMFNDVNYVGKDSHKATHDKFLQDAGGLHQIGDDQIHFIKQWLVEHIKVSDMKYKDVLAGR